LSYSGTKCSPQQPDKPQENCTAGGERNQP